MRISGLMPAVHLWGSAACWCCAERTASHGSQMPAPSSTALRKALPWAHLNGHAIMRCVLCTALAGLVQPGWYDSAGGDV